MRRKRQYYSIIIAAPVPKSTTIPGFPREKPDFVGRHKIPPQNRQKPWRFYDGKRHGRAADLLPARHTWGNVRSIPRAPLQVPGQGRRSGNRRPKGEMSVQSAATLAYGRGMKHITCSIRFARVFMIAQLGGVCQAPFLPQCSSGSGNTPLGRFLIIHWKTLRFPCHCEERGDVVTEGNALGCNPSPVLPCRNQYCNCILRLRRIGLKCY